MLRIQRRERGGTGEEQQDEEKHKEVELEEQGLVKKKKRIAERIKKDEERMKRERY